MRTNLFNENGTIEMIDVSRRMIYQPEPNGKIYADYDDIKVTNKIFTDGEIESVEEPIEEPIKEYYIGGKKYTHAVDKKTTRKVHLKNHTYAVVYTIAEEFLTVGNVSGFFKVTKDITVYVHSKRDLPALRKARKTIKMVENHNRSVDYSSLLTMFLSNREVPSKIEYESEQNGIYTLKK